MGGGKGRRLGAVVVGAGLGLAALAAHAQTPEVLLARNYVRATAQPVTVTDTFEVCDVGGSFTLALDNGPGGEPKVSSGTIHVNGMEIIAEADFNQQVARLERPLTNVQATNTLEVQLGSQPGGTIMVSVLGVQACGLRITAPAAGSTLTGPEVLVQGSLPAGFGVDIGVTVNGVVALVGGRRFAAVVPVDAQVTSLTATAIDAFGAVLGSDTIPVTVQAQAPEPRVRLEASPATGLAPLTVEFSLTSLGPVAQVALDLEGNGSADFTGPSLEGQRFTYAQPGLYLPTVLVTDPGGATHTATAIVQVTDRATLEAILQAKWQGLKDALRQGDIVGAVEFIATSARVRYQAVFTALAPDLPAIDTILTSLTFVRVRGPEAIFEMLRTDDGVEKSFEVRFGVDVDGIWRLRMF